VTLRSQAGPLLAAVCSGAGIGVAVREAGPWAIVLVLVLTAILVGAAQQALP
jgi:hypothetical protein